jgi:hypothetical protein
MTVEFVARMVALGTGSPLLYCPDCGIPLNLLQPDENEPSRLLGTCESCSKWVYLVEMESEWIQTLFVELPNGEAIRQRLVGANDPQP